MSSTGRSLFPSLFFIGLISMYSDLPRAPGIRRPRPVAKPRAVGPRLATLFIVPQPAPHAALEVRSILTSLTKEPSEYDTIIPKIE